MAKGNCKYCNAEKANVGAHEVHCPLNPVNIAKNKAPIKQVIGEDKPTQPSPIQIRISNVQDIVDDGLRAWYNIGDSQRVFRVPLKCGTVSIHDPNTKATDEILSVLILTANGALLPPPMVAGFLGMFPEDAIFTAPEEPVREVQPEELIKEDTIILIEKEVIPELQKEPIPAVQAEKPPETGTRSILDRLRRQRT